MNTGTISHWPKGPAARKKEQMLPAHVHEQASRPRFKARGFRLTDREQMKPGPVRWIMRNGQPVDESGRPYKENPNRNGD